MALGFFKISALTLVALLSFPGIRRRLLLQLRRLGSEAQRRLELETKRRLSVYPKIDWKETSDAHVFVVDVPGMLKGDVNIDIEGGKTLLIGGELRRERPETIDKFHHQELNGGGKFLRRFSLPGSIDADRMTKSYDKGVYTVVVPKCAPL